MRSTYPTKIAYGRPNDVHLDNITHTPAGRIDTKHRYDLVLHDMTLHDLQASPLANFDQLGFTTINLSHNVPLQHTLQTIKATRQLTPTLKQQILTHLNLATFLTADERHRVTLIHPVPDGLFLRQAGPNDLGIVDPATGNKSMGSARNAHVDNNVDGTPLKQYLRGLASYIFHHVSPGHRNTYSPLHIMRIWIPLQQPVRPLVVLDQQTFQRDTEQVAFHLPTGSFLKSEKTGLSHYLSKGVTEQTDLVDVWHVLHGKQQKWYFTSDMNYTQAYVFSTLDGAHTSCSLPGEDIAQRVYLHLNTIKETIR